MPNTNFFDDNLPKEHTEEYPSLMEGNYLACLGRVHIESRRDGVQVIQLDHILIQRVNLESLPGDKPYIYTEYGQNTKTLSLRKRPDGTYLTAGVMYNPSFPLSFDGMSNKFKGFQTYRKRAIAKNFNCLNEESGDIDWKAVAKHAGQVVSFQIFKNEYTNSKGEKKTNMDFSVDSYSLIPGQKISLEQLEDIYEKLEEARQQAEGGTTVPTPEAPPEKDDLPF